MNRCVDGQTGRQVSADGERGWMVRGCAPVRGRTGETSKAAELAGECTHTNKCHGYSGQLDGQMAGHMDGWVDGRMSGEVERMIHVVGGWMVGGWMDGWVVGWMGGWLDGRVGR